MRFVVAFVFAMVACASAHGQTLWRDIPAGATVEQVHKQLPSATDIANPKPPTPSNPVSGLIEYKGFQLAGLDFKATFYFKDGKLVHVRLDPVQDLKGSQGLGAAGSLRDSLLAKYGKPLDESDSGGGLMTIHELQWVSNGVQIGYDLTRIGDSVLISLNYSIPRDSANL